MTDAEREEALAKLVQRRSKLDDDEVVLLHEVWPIIVRAHFSAVRRQVKRRVPEDAVGDVQQEIFLELFRALLDGFPESLRALAGKIASRRIANWLRDNAHDAASVALPSSTSEKPRSSAPGTEGLVERRELLERGEQLRAMLSPDHQAVFDLIIVGEASFTEAADQLRLPEGTFKSRVLALKRAIKEAWEQLVPPGRRGPA